MSLLQIRKELELFENILIDLLLKRVEYKPTSILNDNYITDKYNNLIVPFCFGNIECPIELEECIISMLKKRIEFGNKIIKVKYHENKELFNNFKYDDEIINILRNEEVEKEVLIRVMDKAKRKGLDKNIIFSLYYDILIPMTIQQELFYYKYVIKTN